MEENWNIAAIIMYVFRGVGVFFCAYVVVTSYLATTTAHFRKVKGTLRGLRLHESVDSEGGVDYDLKGEYHYEVRGITHHASKLAFGLLSSNVRWLYQSAFSELQRYYPTVFVYYNPRKPQQAVLLPGIRRFHVFNFLFMVFWNWVVWMKIPF